MTRKKGFTSADHDEWRRLVLVERLTLAEVARRYSTSRQRIHQVVGNTDARARRIAENARARKEALLDELVRRIEEWRLCRVCGCVVIRRVARGGRGATCSPACAQTWDIVAYQVDDEHRAMHRLAVARWHVKHSPDPTVRAHARRVLSDDPPPPNRRRHTQSDRVRDALRRITMEKGEVR